MSNLLHFLQEHKFESFAIAFLLMMIPPLPMYYAAQGGNITLVFVLLLFVVMGNLLVLLVK